MGIYRISRERMLREQIISKGITDKLVIDAMRQVPRHLFVEEALQNQAYEDHPLPIGLGQTISRPFVVASMSQLLEASPGMRVLEIGTGSGYQTAILYEMGLEVYSVERIRELYSRTSNLFMKLRYHSIRLRLADGTEGWEEVGPFDRIIVTAGGPFIPDPLVEQLAPEGIMVIPVGEERKGQRIYRVINTSYGVTTEELDNVSFVDLIGSHGW